MTPEDLHGLTDEDRIALVERLRDQLMEHFQCVQIFASVHKPQEQISQCYTTGDGLYQARFGQIAEWMTMQKHLMRRNQEGDED